MKRTLFTTLILCSLLVFTASAWSLTINGSTEVGIADTLVSSIALSNSGNDEQAWLESLFPGEMIVITDTTEVDWTVTSLAGTYAFDLDGDPADFFIKIGTGNTGSDVDHFLFENNNETGWAVVALSDLNVNNISNFDVGRISHIGAATTKVPEPSTLLLFGAGLIGLGIYGRKKIS